MRDIIVDRVRLAVIVSDFLALWVPIELLL